VRVMSANLLDFVERDPPLVAAVTVAVAALALVGSLLPARRATRIDPMEALRAE